MERGSMDDVLSAKGENLPKTLRVKLLIDAAKGM
jgi:hypothetical protein